MRSEAALSGRPDQPDRRNQPPPDESSALAGLQRALCSVWHMASVSAVGPFSSRCTRQRRAVGWPAAFSIFSACWVSKRGSKRSIRTTSMTRGCTSLSCVERHRTHTGVAGEPGWTSKSLIARRHRKKRLRRMLTPTLQTSAFIAPLDRPGESRRRHRARTPYRSVSDRELSLMQVCSDFSGPASPCRLR